MTMDKEMNKKEQKRKKSNKIVYILFIVISILIISSIILFNYMKNYMSVAKTIELNWGLVLPNDLKEEYYIDTGSSFHGDGERYSIFKGNNFMQNLKEEKNEELEKTISKLFNTLNIPKEKQIDFSDNYSWTKITKKDDNRNYMYCIFDQEVNKFYFYEFLV